MPESTNPSSPESATKSERDASPIRVPKIGEHYRDGKFGLSIEIFPPKTDKGDETLSRTLERLVGYQPAFFSCTYGAGGSTQNKTLDWCSHIQEKLKTPATSHFTCVGSTREELIAWLEKAVSMGVRNIMALRGDPPKGQDQFEAVEGGLRYANELVELIRERHPELGIGVAGYPEKHQECPDAETDLVNLQRKVDAGGDAVYTQMFYDNANFFRFREKYDKAGIGVPLIPGIMPITEFARIKRITQMCAAIFPDHLAGPLEEVQDDKEAQYAIGVEHAIRQCRELIDQGVPGIHFYVLNKSKACEEILNALDLAPQDVVAT